MCRSSLAASTPDPHLQLPAKAIARLLGIAPLVVTTLLAAIAARDAAWSASYAHRETVTAPVILLFFAVASIVGAGFFLRSRHRGAISPTTNQSYYYNDPALCLDKDWLAELDKQKYTWGPGDILNAYWLPFVALFFAVGLRLVTVLGNPSVALTFPIITFMLTCWLGVFGWLSIKERREARPWLLLVILLIAVEGLFGMTENHGVRVIRDKGGALPGMWAPVLGALLLAGIAVLSAAAPRLIRFLAPTNARAEGLRWKVWPVIAAGVVLMIAAIAGIGHLSNRKNDVPVVGRERLPEAFEHWIKALPPASSVDVNAPNPVYFITAEGGGIRAAYWTAKVLQSLSEVVPQFDRRTFMLSVFSGF
jgi:hypothetical protein